MQAVCKFYHDHTYILGHRKEHLAEILGLQIKLLGRILYTRELRDTVYKKCNFRAKLFLQLVIRHHRIFDNIMQDAGRDRLLIHFHVCKYDRNTQRMDNIRLSGFAFLTFMK